MTIWKYFCTAEILSKIDILVNCTLCKQIIFPILPNLADIYTILGKYYYD
jgi:hypothetical protein